MCQMSLAYSTMVRSLLNLPLLAVYTMERRVHSSVSLYTWGGGGDSSSSSGGGSTAGSETTAYDRPGRTFWHAH